MRYYFIKYRNKFTFKLRAAKLNFYKKKFATIEHNPKLTWDFINELTGSKKKKLNNSIKGNIVYNDNIFDLQSNSFDTSNAFNEYFANVGESLAKKIKNRVLINNNINSSSNISFNDIFLKQIKISEVLCIINKLKDETAAGFDKITVKLLKQAAKYISEPLVFILNLCLKQGIFPDKFKLAVVKPLFKSGKVEDISNYRPISMLSNCANIFEKIIKGSLFDFLEQNNLLSKNQFGFRPGKSTTGALYLTT